MWWCPFYVFFFKQKTAYEMRISDWSSDVCSSDLPFQRAVLLGFVFHHAGPCRERPAAFTAGDGGQFRVSDRHLRPCAERQSQLLPEPLAAADVRDDGRAVRGDRKSTRLNSSH